MSRSQNLRRSVVNQIIDGIARGHIPSPLPVQSALGEMFNISRTTVRHILTPPAAARRAGENWQRLHRATQT